MNPGPLRRLVGTLGLVALVPIAWQLWIGGLDPVSAAWRAVVVFVVVGAVGRIVTRYLDSVVRRVESDLASEPRGGATVGARQRQRVGSDDDVEVVELEPESGS